MNIDSEGTCVTCDELGSFEKGVEVNSPSDLYNEVPVVDFNHDVVNIAEGVLVLE